MGFWSGGGGGGGLNFPVIMLCFTCFDAVVGKFKHDIICIHTKEG